MILDNLFFRKKKKEGWHDKSMKDIKMSQK